MSFNFRGIGEVVKPYLAKYPSMKSRTMALAINKTHPEFSIEKLRSSIRGYRGTNGILSRKYGTEKFFNQPYNLPEAFNYNSSAYHINEKCLLVYADIQAPYHDSRAIRTMINWVLKKAPVKPTAVLDLGDSIDCYQLSEFCKNPCNPEMDEEIATIWDIKDEIMDALNIDKQYWKLGNHEERIEGHIFSKVPRIAKLKAFRFENIMRTSKHNCKIIRDRRVIKLGELNAIHGHEFGRNAANPVNPARGLFVRTKASTIGAHHHVTSEHTEKTINDRLITCWSLGCLSDLKPMYRPLNNYNHGFALIIFDGSIFRVMNMRIENGIVY